jgi:uncharacterized protein with HEPN domain
MEPRAAARDRLAHMRAAVAAIVTYTARGRAAFDADGALQDAILYQLVVLGEAAKAARSALLAEPALAPRVDELGIEWSPIARMRDRVAHHYWTTDPEIVWATATTAVPALAVPVDALLAELSKRDDG